MDYPPHLVERVCESVGVSPAFMLGYLLQELAAHHSISARFRQVAYDGRDVHAEIKRVVGEDGHETPRSVLEYLDIISARAVSFAEEKAADPSAQVKLREGVLHQVNNLNALRHVLRQLMEVPQPQHVAQSTE